MSAPESRGNSAALPGVRLGSCVTDVVELIALRTRARELETIAAGRGLSLAARGAARHSADRLALSVRPGRWLLLSPRTPAGVTAADWATACAGAGAVVDLSGGLAALALSGPAAREVLARGCRLDLDPLEFPCGRAAATIMAQVSVTIAALPAGLLLLTPSSTARHFREWLVAAAQAFGLAPLADVTVAGLSGDQW